MTEPILIINYDSLNRNEAIFKAFRSGLTVESNQTLGEEGKTVLEYITDIYFDYGKVTIDKTKFVICKPTFSEFNQLVQNKLSSLKVSFIVDVN